jgi:hypothetical protein
LIAVYPRTPAVPRKVQAFVDFLKVWLAEQNSVRHRLTARVAAE